MLEPPCIQFQPGQSIRLWPNLTKDGKPVSRNYSITNTPDERQCVELMVRHVPGGLCSTWVFEQLKAGMEVKFTGPFGSWRLSDNPVPMVWIAGGSGMGPFWSMLRHMKARGIRRPCTYFFGAAAHRDLYLVEELDRMQHELDWFRFVPALSAPQADDHWEGPTGLITDIVQQYVQPGQVGEAYLCGPPGMIDSAKPILEAKGIAPDHIFMDRFASFRN